MTGGPLCILGATATGKSAVAMAVATENPDIELVSIDSMQIYRGMDIGTAKPSTAERARVRHHLIDIADPAEEYTVSLFQDAWRAVRADVESRGRTPVLVGGTGLYLRAVIDDLDIPGVYPETRAEIEHENRSLADLYARLERLDPLAASRIDPNNERRIVRALAVTIGSGRPFSSYGPGLEAYPDVEFRLLGLRMPVDRLNRRIAERYDEQMESGFLDEVRTILGSGGFGRTARQALGYRELLTHIEDGVPLADALEQAKTRTWRFARRQRKWFDRDPRIEWIDVERSGEIDHGAAVARAMELAAD